MKKSDSENPVRLFLYKKALRINPTGLFLQIRTLLECVSEAY